jgi:hypothetical protein
VNWTDEDLTMLSKSAAAVPGSGVAALVIPSAKKLLVYVIGANGNDILQICAKMRKRRKLQRDLGSSLLSLLQTIKYTFSIATAMTCISFFFPLPPPNGNSRI